MKSSKILSKRNLRESTFIFQVEYIICIVVFSVSIDKSVSGHGKDSIRVLIGKNEEHNEDDALETLSSTGQCVIGTGMVAIETSVHDIKVELNKMKAEKITMTLDCCRTVKRDAKSPFVADLK